MDECQVYRLGIVEYQEAWDLQRQLASQIATGQHPPALLLLEHPHTYTFGRQGHAENLLWQQAQLQDKQVDVHWVDRGGDVTYHGPGQLVGYPLLPLGTVQPDPANGRPRLPRVDYVQFLRDIEKVLIKALAQLGLPSGQIAGQTGVWVQPDVASRCAHCPPELLRAPSKIASIGVKVDARGISQHGFALNVDTDMRYWAGIKACGLANQNQINLAHVLDPAPNMEQVLAQVVPAFARVFGYEMRLHQGQPSI